MKYGIGQKVKVKSFNELAENYPIYNGGIEIDGYLFERQMKVYCCEEYKIKNIFDGLYELDTADGELWLFHENVLEPINKPISHETETVKQVIEPTVEQVAMPTKRPYTRRK